MTPGQRPPNVHELARPLWSICPVCNRSLGVIASVNKPGQPWHSPPPSAQSEGSRKSDQQFNMPVKLALLEICNVQAVAPDMDFPLKTLRDA